MLRAWQTPLAETHHTDTSLSDEIDRETARALLEWQMLAGADEAIGETAMDRFAAAVATPAREAPAPPAPRREASEAPVPAPRREASEAPVPAPRRQTGEAPAPAPAPPPARPAALAPEEAAFAARQAAASAGTLAELEAMVRDFQGCALKATAKSTCFADGDPAGGIMFIGEAPGRDEDLSGTPFVGRAGQLLDRMLAAIELDRSAAYITNVVFWRPPGNRTPTPAETASCRPFTERQIVLAKPDILVFLGGAAAKQMLETSEGIMRLRGKWRTYTPPGGEPIRAIATLHPAFLLRQPQQKKLAWRDFLEIRKALDARR
jgi:DNA polymerase